MDKSEGSPKKQKESIQKTSENPIDTHKTQDINQPQYSMPQQQYSQPYYNQYYQHYQQYQYPNHPHQQYNNYPYNPQFQGYFQGHRGHHSHRGHREHHGGHRWGHRFRGYEQEIPNQYQQFQGYPQAPVFPHNENAQMPLSPPSYMHPQYQFNYQHPPAQIFNFPPPQPPMPFAMGRDQGGFRNKKCHRGGGRGGWHKGRKHRKHSSSQSRSKSSQSSSSSSSNEPKKMKHGDNEKKEQSIKNEQQITNVYKAQMIGFMQSRQINEKQREKIVKVLKNKYPQNAPFKKILQCLQTIQKENLVFRMSYIKIMKVLLKWDLELFEAIPKLAKIQSHKIKKYEADIQFAQTYGEQSQTPLLEVNQLIMMQANGQKILFLIDGNNILPTNKHFRKYFQSKNPIQKVYAQIRTRWYISHCLSSSAILFFDQRFEDKDYEAAYKYIFPSKVEQKKATQVQVIYGEGKKADDKIVQKMQGLSKSQEKVQIVLVSADRDLNMRCQQIKPILHTSGRYFFKYCKYVINRKYKGEKQMKLLVRGIPMYEEHKL